MRATCLFAVSLTLLGMHPLAQAQSIFQVVPTPNLRPTPHQNGLFTAAASSASDIWAVGQSTIHFDGTQWTAYPAPRILGDNLSLLTGVADISPTEAWAVGYSGTLTAVASQVIERWNGTKWSEFPGPVFNSGDIPVLYAMAAVNANDIWAIGSLNLDGDGVQALFEHWDGMAWTAYTNNGPWAFEAASADAANDIWAVGEGPFSVHFDGTSWNFVPTPSVGSGPNMLHGVATLAPNDVWAVGYSTASDKEVPTKTLIEHYDGKSWSVVPSPNVGPDSRYQSNKLWGVTAVSPTDIWAFGEYLAASGSEEQFTLLLHWDGASWSLAPCPNPITGPGTVQGNLLWGGVVTGSGNVWIVGAADVGVETLVLHTTGG